MKNLSFVQPLVQRWREESSGVVVPADVARRPFRLWMTGSLAVVMAAMIPMRAMAEMAEMAEFDRSQPARVLRHSRFNVGETLQRIEFAARDRGLSVLARLPGDRSVLVLASSVGGTLVVMDEADSRPAMPLSLVVSMASDGGADVMIGSDRRAASICDWSEVPPSVADDLRALPGVVERALV